MQIKVILTGATGMVGEGVLLECLQHNGVSEVLVINRKPSGFMHPKLKEIVHADFFNLAPVREQLRGYDACFFCAGVSSIGMKEEEFYKLTYTMTMHMAELLSSLNPGMTFCYVSGAGTDSTEQGKRMWARVKGKTENDLARLPFKKAYAFRPGLLHPTKGQKNVLRAYTYLGWLYYPLLLFFPASASTLRELGLAMIHAVLTGYPKHVLEVKDIVTLAKKT
jgi:uncharacterized protein YbjT (DUF2867 family)